MTLLSFFGCGLIAFGPSLAIFFLYVARNAQLVLLAVSSAFFWLVSILIASAIWYVAKPAQDNNAITIVYSVLLQELFRWLLYKLINLRFRLRHYERYHLVRVAACPVTRSRRDSMSFVSEIVTIFCISLHHLHLHPPSYCLDDARLRRLQHLLRRLPRLSDLLGHPDPLGRVVCNAPQRFCHHQSGMSVLHHRLSRAFGRVFRACHPVVDEAV
ncbi:Aph-1 protein-domain-containing protein [Jimgerdemannia flammicorona]|uniref:Aph-1 protein-domain-containing protein n=1 Tax=Jimgerdemannia flammicorona TaxID=994334 RepID=A0A433QNT6_9FUNG|nr:Aph-1 protein-domain-containing protein [Jimgerdemannia flammicorona]